MTRKYMAEPFKIKVVEPIAMTTREQREEAIERAGYNTFLLKSKECYIDLLTDSGTTAMSDNQWAGMMLGDEAYAGSVNFYQLEGAVQDLYGFKHVVPTHQGRGAENLLSQIAIKPGDYVPGNMYFTTTRYHQEHAGGRFVDVIIDDAHDAAKINAFKGNIDLDKLEKVLKENPGKVPYVCLHATVNMAGGQPVSMANIEATHELCQQFGKPLIIDGCRFAENAYFIKLREAPYRDWSAKKIAQKFLSYAEIVTFSGKKDALANIGGLVCLNDPATAERLKNRLIVTEGFPTYGGLAGRDLAAMAQGLREVLDEHYLQYRLRTIEWMVERLVRHGVPALVPAGGHAVYLDAARFFPQIPLQQYPGISLVVELYLRGGIRSVELGGVAFGHHDKSGREILPRLHLVRLAMPRRVYTEAHAGYVVDCICELYDQRQNIGGYRFKYEAPVMRHFRSTFEKV